MCHVRHKFIMFGGDDAKGNCLISLYILLTNGMTESNPRNCSIFIKPCAT